MSHRSRRRPIRGVFVASLLVAIGLLSAGTTQASTLPTLSFAVTASSITVTGPTQSGAVNVVTSASGVKEGTAILLLIRPGITVAEIESVLAKGIGGKDPNRTSKYGTIVYSGEATPGKSEEAQIYLQPGQYLVLVPGHHGSGAKAHMFFTVTAAASPLALATPQATIRSIEFGFTGPTTLHDGELVRFENEGFLIHMDIAIPVKSHSAAKQVVKDLLSGKEKGIEKLATGEPVNFAPPMSHEAFRQETITEKPGWYVQACFMETQDGRDHTRLGMERIIKIVK
ncbi:MAG TPA: hypothetical protein VKG38_04750 [Solirubrobacteraceae bacterium]|nr:hypothetical protein [Solirubrobacteraceae bacterium]